MPITLKRVIVDDIDKIGPGEYIVNRGRLFANGLVATVCCPVCGKLSTVGRAHSVNTSGEVSPSYRCPHPPCEFHAWVNLAHWPGQPTVDA